VPGRSPGRPRLLDGLAAVESGPAGDLGEDGGGVVQRERLRPGHLQRGAVERGGVVEQGGGPDVGQVVPGDEGGPPVAGRRRDHRLPVLEGGEEGDEVGVHAVPQERVPQAGRPDRLLGGGVVAHQGERRVGAARAHERGVDDPLDAGLRDGPDGGAVLLQPVLGLAGRHQVDGVAPASAADRPAPSA
jgi:hypothetical protein